MVKFIKYNKEKNAGLFKRHLNKKDSFFNIVALYIKSYKNNILTFNTRNFYNYY